MKTSSIAVVLAATACGVLAFAFASKSFASDGTWSCVVAARLSCAQWPDAAFSGDSGAREASCRAMGGIVAHEPCPAVDAVGACVGSANARVVYYAPRAPHVERRSCAQLGGTWDASTAALGQR